MMLGHRSFDRASLAGIVAATADALDRTRRGAVLVRHRQGLLVIVCLIAVLTGCTPSLLRSVCEPYEEYKQRGVLRLRAELAARRAWTDCHERLYAVRSDEQDVKQGYVVGFVETAMGRNGCPPPVPEVPLFSRASLTHSYPNANAWYEGYQLGHTQALSMGADRWRLAPLDPSLLGCGIAAEPIVNIHESSYLDSAEPIEIEPPVADAEHDQFAPPVLNSGGVPAVPNDVPAIRELYDPINRLPPVNE